MTRKQAINYLSQAKPCCPLCILKFKNYLIRYHAKYWGQIKNRIVSKSYKQVLHYLQRLEK